MEHDIAVLELSNDMFTEFTWDALEANATRSAYKIDLNGFEFKSYPNDLLTNGYPVFVLNKEGQGLTAYFLAARLTEEREEELLFGQAGPLSVFTAKKTDLEAVHTIAGSFQLDMEALDAFKDAELINQTASFSVGQSWRPWQKKVN